jgi:hypothetical protein
MGTDGGEGGEHGFLFPIFDWQGRGADFEQELTERTEWGTDAEVGLFNHGFRGGEFW